MNPFAYLLERMRLNDQAQGSGNRNSYLLAILTIGSALHAASPTSWNAKSLTAADEVLFRLRALGLGDTFAYPEIARFLVENYR